MNLGLKEAMSVLDLWQALEPVFSRSGGSSVGAAVAEAGGSAAPKGPGSFAGRDPGRKKEPSTPTTLPVPILAYADNQSTIVVLGKGYSAKLTHISRTHRVNMHWLQEVFKNLKIPIHYTRSDKQAADIFTKAFLQLEPWIKLCSHMGIFDPIRFAKIISSVAIAAQAQKLLATVVLSKGPMPSPKMPPKAPVVVSAVGQPPPVAKATHAYPPPPPGPPAGSTAGRGLVTL